MEVEIPSGEQISLMAEPAFAPPPVWNATASLRQPPYSREAEQSVLGAILLDNEVFDQVADLLTADDFYIGAHRHIFHAMADLMARGDAVDPVILKQYLEKNDELEGVGGGAYLVELANTVPTAANARAYARLVHDRSILRDLARQATTIVERVHAGEGRVGEILDEAEQNIFEVGERLGQRRSQYYSLREVLQPVFERIDRMMEQKDAVTGVPTGFRDLDHMLSGLQPSDLLILAGRPAMGKTALAINMAANAAVHRIPVGVFSLEMSKEQLANRVLSFSARVDAQKMRTGMLNEDEYAALGRAVGELADLPLYIDDTPALTVMALRAKARRLVRERKVQLLVVDYLQLMHGSGQMDNRVHEITMISQGLKAIAKELHVPVIALSQLSRQVESRTDKRPILSDLRESGSIEQDADVVMFVFREEYYKPDDTSLKGKAEVIVAKQRNGPTGAVPLTFLHAYTKFENYARPDMLM